jgi:hypothetical protein
VVLTLAVLSVLVLVMSMLTGQLVRFVAEDEVGYEWGVAVVGWLG